MHLLGCGYGSEFCSEPANRFDHAGFEIEGAEYVCLLLLCHVVVGIIWAPVGLSGALVLLIFEVFDLACQVLGVIHEGVEAGVDVFHFVDGVLAILSSFRFLD